MFSCWSACEQSCAPCTAVCHVHTDVLVPASKGMQSITICAVGSVQCELGSALKSWAHAGG